MKIENGQHQLYILLLGIFLTVLTACSSTTLSGSWSDPNFTGDVNKIFIVGLAGQETTRRLFEDELSRQLASFDVTGVPSYLSVPNREDIAESKISLNAAESGADVILMASVTGARTEVVVDPGRVTSFNTGPAHRWDRSRYRHYRSFFDHHRHIIYEPATIRQFEIVTVEASLYAAETGELVWSAQLETVLERNIQSLLTDFTRAVVRDLHNNNLI